MGMVEMEISMVMVMVMAMAMLMVRWAVEIEYLKGLCRGILDFGDKLVLAFCSNRACAYVNNR